MGICTTARLLSGGAFLGGLFKLAFRTDACLKRFTSFSLGQWQTGDWMFTAWLAGSAAFHVWALYVERDLKKMHKMTRVIHIEAADNRVERAQKAKALPWTFVSCHKKKATKSLSFADSYSAS